MDTALRGGVRCRCRRRRDRRRPHRGRPPGPAHGLAAPRDLAELLERLASERARGYSVAGEEVGIGLTSVGHPIRDRLGDLTAVVNISGPSSRLVGRTDEIAQRLRAASTTIESVLLRPHGSTPH